MYVVYIIDEIRANCYEAKYAESKADFLHKLKISRKENAETIFWLEVLADSGIVPQEKLAPLIQECEEIGKILTTIIKNRENIP